MAIQSQKHLFDLPEDITYLNIASQSPAFKAITEAGLKGLKQKSQPHTITISDYFEPVIELKSLFANLIEAEDYNQIKETVKTSLLKKVEKSTLSSNAENRLISELSKFFILTESLGWKLVYKQTILNTEKDFEKLLL